MNFKESLEAISQIFTKENIKFALAGGLVANQYRNEIRYTQDIDLAIMLTPSEVERAKQVLEKLNLEMGLIRKGDLEKVPFRRQRTKSEIQLLVGRNPDNKEQVGIDFLLMSIPWVKDAIIRAESNLVKIFKNLYPAITIEDFIISKLYAVSLYERYKDLDDLEQVLDLKNENVMDLVYLSDKLMEHKLSIPKDLRKKIRVHSVLGKVSREVEKSKKI